MSDHSDLPSNRNVLKALVVNLKSWIFKITLQVISTKAELFLIFYKKFTLLLPVNRCSGDRTDLFEKQHIKNVKSINSTFTKRIWNLFLSTVIFLKYVWPFFNIMHGIVKDSLFSSPSQSAITFSKLAK